MLFLGLYTGLRVFGHSGCSIPVNTWKVRNSRTSETDSSVPLTSYKGDFNNTRQAFGAMFLVAVWVAVFTRNPVELRTAALKFEHLLDSGINFFLVDSRD